MSYIALATPIGPWIAPTLVLIATGIVRALCITKNRSTIISLAVAGSSVGGILATACAFSFPTLYFLDSTLFSSWLAHPWYFIGFVAWLSLAAGLLGFLLANIWEYELIEKQEIAFPIGQLVYKMIAAQSQLRKALELFIGFVSAFIFSIAQGGILFRTPVIPVVVTLMRPFHLFFMQMPAVQLRLDMLPMLLAIGFISGHIVTIPLAVGTISKLLLLDPLNVALFSTLSNADFVLAFCSGLVAIGALQSFLEIPLLIHSLRKSLQQQTQNDVWRRIRSALTVTEIVIAGIIIVSFLTYCRFSVVAQLYLLIGTIICTYQIVIIAGKIGLAQLGRFATFVMVPAMFLFGINPLWLTVIASFVEICAGVATDMLFGRKMGHLAQLNRLQVHRVQLLGLVLSSFMVGIVFWLLITHFGLGSPELFAQRAQARALLINMRSFNIIVLCIGALFGLLLKWARLNPMLVLGGLLMPIPYSLGLILGGLLALLVKNHQKWEPFWSGVFAANSITELIKTLW
jgi:hypothetical protein